MTKTESCVFFGSGPVAARCLELLLDHTDIEAVVTKPRASHHKGDVPVLRLAEERGLPIHTVSTKGELDELVLNQPFRSRYGILIDFGIIVSSHTIDSFELGIINSHFSLLPQLRGADPITFSILEGHEKTGVSLMLIDEGMDTGKLLTQRTLKLDGTETTSTLTEQLIDLSDQLLREYLPPYLSGELKPRAQPHPDRATYSRKLTKADGIIDWSRPAIEIERQIRAFDEWPQSRTKLGDLDVIITAAEVIKHNGDAGSYAIDGSDLLIYTGTNALRILALKPSGKKEMPVQAFLAGYKNRL